MKAVEGEILIYQSGDGETGIEVNLVDETVWLTQAQMAKLFQKSKSTVNEHIRNVYEEKELEKTETTRKFGNSEFTFKKPKIAYNLDVIISVGYRVKSHQGTHFRKWATKHLREFLIKGFVMDDRRMAEGHGPANYFEELLNRVRDIRTSEKNFYDKVKQIYTTSIDYDAGSDMSRQFYAVIQNKFHWAIHGQTASELISRRISASKPNMGLTNWSGENFRVKDLRVAKNYLTEEELTELNLLVEQYLSFAQLQARRQKPMYMRDWLEKLNGFIKLNDMEVLDHAGKVSRKRMLDKVKRESARFRSEFLLQRGA